MKIQHTPAPLPSTILSLAPTSAEQFPYRDIQAVQAITLDPQHNTYTLSGPSAAHPDRLRTYTLPRDTPLPPAVPRYVQDTLSAEFSRYATPALRAVPAHAPAQRQHLADPSGPSPTPAQQDSISRSSGRTHTAAGVPRSLTPQPQHLAAPAPAPRTPGRAPGAHRA